MNTVIEIPTENINPSEIKQTKVAGINAQWIRASAPEYKGDMTKKPIGTLSVHLLIWSSDKCTYLLQNKDKQPISIDEAVKIAESFMEAQK